MTSTALQAFLQGERSQRIAALRSIGASRMALLEAEIAEARLTLFGPLPKGTPSEAAPPNTDTVPLPGQSPAQPHPGAPPADPVTPRGTTNALHQKPQSQHCTAAAQPSQPNGETSKAKADLGQTSPTDEWVSRSSAPLWSLYHLYHARMCFETVA